MEQRFDSAEPDIWECPKCGFREPISKDLMIDYQTKYYEAMSKIAEMERLRALTEIALKNLPDYIHEDYEDEFERVVGHRIYSVRLRRRILAKEER